MPGFEGPTEQDKAPIAFTKEEWTKYANLPENDPRLGGWMAEKGISYDSGFVEVEMDGQKKKMNTNKEDFGTILDE